MKAEDHAQIVFIDTETTGLEDHHEVVEVGWVDGLGTDSGSLIVPHTLVSADPEALQVNRYYKRGLNHRLQWRGLAELEQLSALLSNRIIAGANPGFDDRFLARLLHRRVWRYRMIDVTQRAAQVMDAPVLGLRDTAAALRERSRLDIPEPDHTALGDALCARACWVALCVLERQMQLGRPVTLCRCGLPLVLDQDEWRHANRDTDHHPDPVVDFQGRTRHDSSQAGS